MRLSILVVATLLQATQAFQIQPQLQQQSIASSTALFGRAAAVRAATKGKADAKRSKVNAVFGKRIILAVKQGGGSPNPESNTVLRDIIKAAKANSVPVENINRAIKRASEASVGDFTESTFEAYGYGGASMIINVLSDNANRATADIKSTVNKRGGKIAEKGSVLFMYDRRGKVEVNAELDEEALMDAAIEAGCEDMELVEGDEEGSSIVYCCPTEAGMMADAVKSLGHEEVKVNLAWITKAPVEVSEEEFEKNMEIIDILEELDDVDLVEHNMSN